MAADISAKIKLEGETEFKRGVTSANKELKAMNAELKAMSAEAKAEGKSMKDMADYTDKMAKAMDAAAKKVEAYGKGLENAQRQYDKTVATLADYNKKLEEAKKKLEEMKNSGTATEEEMKSQQKVVGDLEKAIESGNKAMQEAGNRVNDWKKGLADAKREQTELGEATEDTADAQEQLNDAVGNITKWEVFKEMASQAAQYLIQFADAALDAAQSYETSLAKISSIAGSSYNLEQAKDELLDLAVAYGMSTDDLAEATYQAMSAAVDTAEATRFVEKAVKLAKGGFTDTATAVDVLTTAINAYNLSTDEAGKISDMLVTTQNRGKTTVAQLADNLGAVIPTAAAFGVELDNLSAAYITMTRNGISTTNASTYIRAMFNELGKDGTKVAKILNEKTGKSFAQLNKAGYSLGDIMKILGDEVNNDTTAFVNLWSNVRAGQGALSIMNSGIEQYNEDLYALNNSTGAATEAYETMADTSENMANRLDASMEKALIAVGDTMIPFENYMKEQGIAVLNWFAEVLDELPEGVRDVIGAIMSIGSEAAKATPYVMNLASQVAMLKAAGALTGTSILGSVGAGLATIAAPLALGLAAGVAAFEYFKGKIKELEELTKEETELANAAKNTKQAFKDAEEEVEAMRSGAYATYSATEKAAAAADLLQKMQNAQVSAQRDMTKVNKESAESTKDFYYAVAQASNDLAFFGLATQESNFAAMQNASAMRDLSEVTEQESESMKWLEGATHAYNIEAAQLSESSGEIRDKFLDTVSALGDTSEGYLENVQAMDELTQKHVEATQQIQANIDTLEEQMQGLVQEYEATREQFSTIFSGIFSIWDEAPQVQAADMKQILTNLQTQTAYFDTYYDNMKKAIENGYSEAFVNSLNDGSEKSAQILAGMAADTEGAYAEMVSAEYDKQQESINQLADYSAKVQTNFENRYDALEKAQAEAIAEMNKEEEMYQAQVQTIMGGIRGVQDFGSQLVQAYTNLALRAVSAYKSALQIESPSKVFEQLGEYTVAGAIEGTEKMADALGDTYASLATLPATAYATQLGETKSSAGILAGGAVVNEVHIYLGDQELTDYMADGVIREISSQQRAAAAYAGGY